MDGFSSQKMGSGDLPIPLGKKKKKKKRIVLTFEQFTSGSAIVLP